MVKNTSNGQPGSAMSRRNFLKLAGLAGAGLAVPAWSLAGAQRVAAQTSLSYWHHLASDAEKAGLQAIVDAYKAAKNVTVNVELVPNADFMAKFITSAQGNSLPDSTMATQQRLPDMAAAGGLTDITERVDAWAHKADYSDVMWQGASFDGKVYAVPGFMLVYWMFYRVDHFEEVGIKDFPKTWDEFLEAAIKLTDPAKGRFGFAMRGGAGGPVHILDVIESWNGPVLDAEGKITMDEQKTTDALRYYGELLTKYNVVSPSAPSDGYQQISTMFKAGQASMMPTHTGALADIQGTLGKDGKMFMSAATPGGAAAQIARILPINNGMGSAAQADATWDWLSFWGEAENQITFNQKTGYFPTLTAALTDKRVTENIFNKAAIDAAPNYHLNPNFLGAAFWFDQVIGPAFQQVLTKQIQPEDAAKLIIDGLATALKG
ncbi:MAG: sugar ABC transporter substrate-binding protein [Anaerolineae bacterium]|nr:sugar ABC transporter substrate-binding protein [Anaerolineae bacterium]